MNEETSARATAPVSNQAKDTARNQLTQIVGKLTDNSSTQNASVVTALDAIATAINAKPSA